MEHAANAAVVNGEAPESSQVPLRKRAVRCRQPIVARAGNQPTRMLESLVSVPETIRVPELESQVVDVLAGPDERSQSVVSVLNALREAYDVDPEVDAVRRALRNLERKNVVEVVYRTVPTFRLAVERDEITVEIEE